MQNEPSFGHWLKQRRKTLDLTQAALGRGAGCTAAMIRKIEAGLRRPSHEVAALLAECLKIPFADRADFIHFARGTTARLGEPPVAKGVPGRGAGRPRGDVPALTTSMVGRKRELATVCERLCSHEARLVTLTGPGGVGKTRLALQAATDLCDHFADGVVWVELGPVSDAALVASRIAVALHVKETGGDDLVEQIKAHLREKQLLLVLDNFEQVVDAAPLIADLLSGSPRLKMLLTSRVRLHLRSEHEFPVPPLGVPNPRDMVDVLNNQAMELDTYPAITLFVERAQQIRPDFTLTNANVAAVAQICAQLDGLPLAIELAAARSKLLSPNMLLDRMNCRLDLLIEGAHDRPARQKSLRDTIAWSCGLLQASDQALFRRLAAFAGGFTPAAAEALCAALPGSNSADAPDDEALPVLDRLSSLIDNSLIYGTDYAGELRFSMLNTIRQYAGEQLLNSYEAALVRRQHAHVYLNLAEEAEVHARGPFQADWFGRLEQEHDNLRAALTWSYETGEVEIGLRLVGALWLFWGVHGHWREGYGWAERLLAIRRDERSFVRAKALFSAGWLVRAQHNYARTVELHEEALAIFRELDNKEWIGELLHNLAIVARAQGDLSRAAVLHEESRALFEGLNLRWNLAWSLFNIAELLVQQHAYRQALTTYARSLSLMRDVQDTHGVASILMMYGEQLFYEGDWSQARALFEEGADLFRTLDEKYALGVVSYYLGRLACERGNLRSAGVLLDESLTLARGLKENKSIAKALYGMGKLSQKQRDFVQAEARLKESLALFHELGQDRAVAGCIHELAVLYAMMDQACRGARLLGVAEELGHGHIRRRPIERMAYERSFATLCSRLGEATFTAMRQEGKAILRDRMFIEALPLDVCEHCVKAGIAASVELT